MIKMTVILLNKQTKSFITRDSIADEILENVTRNIRYAFLILLVAVLFCLPMLLFIFSKPEITGVYPLDLTLSILIVGFPIYGSVISLFCLLTDRKKLLKRDIEIELKPLIRKRKYLNRGYKPYDQSLHFKDFRRFPIHPTTYQLASPGDAFYIVHYKNSRTIKKVYSAKMYEYK